MYKVFINEALIVLTEKKSKNIEKNILNYKDSNIVEIIKSVEKKSVKIILLTDDINLAWIDFKSNFKVIESAGGLVKNKKNETLFIFRLGKWDLPKGKIEIAESREIAAIREVEEECGVKNLTIIKPLQNTYHIFTRDNMYNLKITYWFLMHTDFKGLLTPQIEEDITKVVWKNKNKYKLDLENTYKNVKLLLKE